MEKKGNNSNVKIVLIIISYIQKEIKKKRYFKIGYLNSKSYLLLERKYKPNKEIL